MNKATTEIARSVKSSFTLITLRQERTEVLGYNKRLTKETETREKSLILDTTNSSFIQYARNVKVKSKLMQVKN